MIKNFKEFLFEGRVKRDERIELFRDKDYIVVAPLTNEASCKYGAFTKWCISAPNNDAWKDGVKIVFIIQRNPTITQEEQDSIDKFSDYYEKIQDGEDLTDDEIREYYDLMDKGFDFSKIALVKGNRKIEIWDSNNVNINDTDINPYFTVYNLPFPDEVIESAMDYLK